jgi:malate dehydrogenase (oxaloacetate-decarboxylating)(NADP+)
MFMAAARTLAQHVSESDLDQGSLYPPLNRVRDVSAHIAVAVAEVAYRDNLAEMERPDDLLEFITEQMYDPHYVSYV